MKEKILDKEKMSKHKKTKLVFCLFDPLIGKWFVGLNDKKNPKPLLYIFKYIYTYIYIYIYTYIYINIYTYKYIEIYTYILHMYI